MSASTPTQSAQGPPPVPPTKPVLSSPGAYMANFSSSTTSPTSGIVTAGIHGVNKSSEKPAIAARPIPPPTLPKYSSYNKIDRERNEFGGKFDRSERDKDGLGGSYRLASLDRLAQRQRLLEQNNGFGASDKNGTDSHYGSSITQSLQSKREMFFKSDNHNSTGHQNHSASIHNNNTTNSNHHNENTSTNGTPTGQPEKTLGSATNNSTGVSTNGVNHVASALNNLQMKERQVSFESNSDSNKIANDKTDREKTNSVSSVIKVKPKEMDGYVGFANLPDQVYRKAVKRGFEFTLMVVGESGLGKSTLINTMFLADIYNQEQHPGPSHRIKKTVAVETTKVLLKENCVNLSLTVVDTPGFGDAVDNSNCWEPVINFVESKYEEYLTAESRVHRKALNDNRVHCCLYFIAPSGHGLKPLDVEFMQRLCDKVNIIPVIAKADTMTPEEVTLFKKQILNEIAQHKIKIYDFPEPNDDEEEAKTLKQLRSRVPFAIVGANTVLDIEGKKIRGRRYPWGIAEVENLDHCDFIALRKMMIRTHLQDLKDVTNNVHYENYRCRKLAGLGTDGQTLSNTNPLAQMEEEKREHEQKLENMQIEMERVFQVKVLEKKKKLKDSEVELQRRHEERKKALENQIQELEKQRREFEQEKKQWEEVNGVTLDELRRRSLESNSKEAGTLTSRIPDESKGRRVFGSLLRRHTSFGAPDSSSRGSTFINFSSAQSQDSHE